MQLVLFIVEQWREIGFNFCLIHVFNHNFYVLLVLESISDVLEVNQLFRTKQIGIAISKLQNVSFLFGVNHEANFFLELHGDDINSLVSCL
jgi:hypothetical protein